MTLNEFSLIEHFFTKQSVTRDDVVLGIGDDCALVNIEKKQQLAITTDTLVGGVHFPSHTSPFDIGYKSLAVNLSDLAAMGATPTWITLALTLPEADPAWLTSFSQGLFELAERYRIELIGGDITRGPLTITIQAHGSIPPSLALRRDAAKVGDLIYVTHTLGDAALGLLLAQNKISIPNSHQDYFMKRLNRPEPRIEIGTKLLNIAHAAIDISDGLYADLQHILENSQVGAEVNVDNLPLSDALRESVSREQAITLALNGGDDYELCFTVPPNKQFLLPKECTCIGKVTEGSELNLRFKDGTPYNGTPKGYQHFS